MIYEYYTCPHCGGSNTIFTRDILECLEDSDSYGSTETCDDCSKSIEVCAFIDIEASLNE